MRPERKQARGEGVSWILPPQQRARNFILILEAALPASHSFCVVGNPEANIGLVVQLPCSPSLARNPKQACNGLTFILERYNWKKSSLWSYDSLDAARVPNRLPSDWPCWNKPLRRGSGCTAGNA